MTDSHRLRNFAIIAHIDHGKSTLADRFLEVCGAVHPREARAQMLDSMDLERERGITIKARTTRLEWRGRAGDKTPPWILNLVDTPGHVDFAYEVSRSLAACEGSLLVVDASQGVEAQTLANVYAAIEQDHEILVALNKIDLPAADSLRVAAEIEAVIGLPSDSFFPVSAKTGEGIPALLDGLVARLPAPSERQGEAFKALVADSRYDPFLGVVLLVRVVAGRLATGDRLRFLRTGATFAADAIGIFTPEEQAVDTLGAGEIGFVVTGLRKLEEARVGDTVVFEKDTASLALKGFALPQAVVFCGLFPEDADLYSKLRDALAKLALNDSALFYEPESSQALGFGFRCGFLGLLHLEIVVARLEREFALALITTAPSVGYRLLLRDGTSRDIHAAAELPDVTQIAEFYEPWVRVTLFAPKESLGAVLALCEERRGERLDLSFPAENRAVITYLLPLSETVFDFHDRLKSLSGGFASYDSRFEDWRSGDLVKVSILVNGEVVEALSFIAPRSSAERRGRQICKRLKDEIPRQLYKVAVQAAIGGKVIARETVSALRKDVTAKCYGGDVTRKRKLLEKQKAGKKRMRQVGQVEIPHAAFLAVLRRDEN